ncbi:hypothetical protein BJX70DRAFT_397258 [Aspergillus crustosus]
MASFTPVGISEGPGYDPDPDPTPDPPPPAQTENAQQEEKNTTTTTIDDNKNNDKPPKKPNTIEEIYSAQAGYILLAWFASLPTLALAAATIARTPKSTSLYSAACFVLAVAVSHIVYFVFAMAVRPAVLTQTKTQTQTQTQTEQIPRGNNNKRGRARPPAWFLISHTLTFCLWGAAGPVILIYRDRFHDQSQATSRTTTGINMHRVSTIEKLATACGAFAVITFFFYFLASTFTLNLVFGRFSGQDIADFGHGKGIRVGNGNGNGERSPATTTGQDAS